MNKISWAEFFTIKCNEFNALGRDVEFCHSFHRGGPMDEKTYEHCVSVLGKKMADEANVKRSRTYIGWLAVGFFDWVRTFNRTRYGV